MTASNNLAEVWRSRIDKFKLVAEQRGCEWRGNTLKESLLANFGYIAFECHGSASSTFFDELARLFGDRVVWIFDTNYNDTMNTAVTLFLFFINPEDATLAALSDLGVLYHAK